MKLPIDDMVDNMLTLGWDLAEDVESILTYTSHATPTYNAETGVVTAGTSTATITAIVLQYGQKEMVGAVRAGDEKVLVRVSELGGLVPSVDDFLLDGSVKRMVLGIQIDPTGKLLTLHTRKAAV